MTINQNWTIVHVVWSRARQQWAGESIRINQTNRVGIAYISGLFIDSHGPDSGSRKNEIEGTVKTGSILPGMYMIKMVVPGKRSVTRKVSVMHETDGSKRLLQSLQPDN